MACFLSASLVFSLLPLLFSFLPSPVAAAPLHVAHGAAAGLLTGLETGLVRREDPEHIDGSAGTHITPGTVGAIIGGAVGVILLLLLLCWCGRMRKW